MKKQIMYIVFYVNEFTMRERIFSDKETAEKFALSVNSEAIKI
jgi:hypothetical protein